MIAPAKPNTKNALLPPDMMKKAEELMNKEGVKLFLKKAKEVIARLKEFFSDKQHEKAVVTILAGISVIVLGMSILQVVNQSKALNKETDNLEKLEKYDIQELRNNAGTQNTANTANTIDDLLKAEDSIKKETVRYENHKEELQSSYSSFLQYFLVPKINIRKEAYTDKISINLVGKEFLESNPFNDINLYEKWSNFFRSTEKNQINQIDDLKIGQIEESDYGLYKIKISFGFVAPTKNALLFLADKISMTSDKENISLLGEFVYYLRQQIKTDKASEINKLQESESNKDIASDENKIIGKELYKWVFSKSPSTLIDDKVINKTIKNIMECGGESDSVCFYKFREKYRNIAELAYTVGSTTSSNKSNDLKLFFKNMPPLMTVQNFTFSKRVKDQIGDNSSDYAGTVELYIYGQNIPTNEIQEIAKTLNKKCFGTEEELSPGIAIAKVTNELSNAAVNDEGNYTKISRGTEFKSLLENIDKEYVSASNYKKTIRLFEVYRMLNEGGFCSSI